MRQCDNVLLRISDATSIVNGSIHQCDRRFCDVSRGRQCAFTSLPALLFANSCDVSQWTAHIVDQLLTEGVDNVTVQRF